MLLTGKPIVEQLIGNAKILRDYMRLGHELRYCDIAIVGGSPDLSVPIYASDLYNSGLFDTIVVSGGFGRNTLGNFSQPEAQVFKDIMCKNGVPGEKVFTDIQATNTGENVVNAMSIVEEKGLKHDSIMLIHKPYMERRFFATFEIQFPELIQRVITTSMDTSFEAYTDRDDIGFDQEELIHMIVGDMHRVIEYPDKGFQSYQHIPENVVQAYTFLIDKEYIHYIN